MDAERKTHYRLVYKEAETWEEAIIIETLDALDAAEARAEEWHKEFAGQREYTKEIVAERDRLRELGQRVVFEGLHRKSILVPSDKLRDAIIALGHALNRPECREVGGE